MPLRIQQNRCDITDTGYVSCEIMAYFMLNFLVSLDVKYNSTPNASCTPEHGPLGLM